MSFVFFVAGVIILLTAVLKYTSIIEDKQKIFTLGAYKIKEEFVWMLLFLIGFIFVLVFIIDKLEPQVGSRGL